MKAEIKRVVEPTGACWFIVESEAGTHHYAFKENQPEDSVWNEERNYKRALEMVKLIESGATKKEEVVYPSPSTPPVREGQTYDIQLRVQGKEIWQSLLPGIGQNVFTPLLQFESTPVSSKYTRETFAAELVRRYNAFPELNNKLQEAWKRQDELVKFWEGKHEANKALEEAYELANKNIEHLLRRNKTLADTNNELLKALQDLHQAVDLSRYNIKKDFSFLSTHAAAGTVLHNINHSIKQ